MIEICPRYGPLAITASAKLPRNLKSTLKEVTVLHKKHLMNPEKLKIIPIEQVRQLALEAARTFPGLHHKKRIVIGIPEECLANLEVVVGLTDQKQRDWTEGDLQNQAQEDIRSSQQQLGRLRPLALKYLASKADAEAVLQTLRKESDFASAAQNLRKIIYSRNAIAVGGVEVIDEAPNAKAHIDLAAKKSYLVTLSVKEMKDDGVIVCQLRGGDDLQPLFIPADFHTRLLHFLEEGDARMLLGYCMVLGLEFRARISVRVSLSGQGLTFKGSIIQFADKANILTSVQKAMTMLSTDLFDSSRIAVNGA